VMSDIEECVFCHGETKAPPLVCVCLKGKHPVCKACEENLELWVGTHPTGQRVEDLVKFAREIIAKYDRLVAEELMEE